MVRVIHACCVLHNIANANDLEIFEPPLNDQQSDMEARIQRIEMDNDAPLENETGVHVRNAICRRLYGE